MVQNLASQALLSVVLSVNFVKGHCLLPWLLYLLLQETFVHCLESLMVFINSHLLLKHTNKLGFIVCHGSNRYLLHAVFLDPFLKVVNWMGAKRQNEIKESIKSFS